MKAPARAVATRAAVATAAAVVALSALPAAAGPGASPRPVARSLPFAELLRAHVDARVGFARLPAGGGTGAPIREPAVYVSITSRALLLYGTAVLALDRGAPPQAEVRSCGSGAPCLPALRDAVRAARGELARALRARPDVLIAAAGDAPYSTLLLVARSVAEAGAARSVRLVIRSDQQLRSLPIWVAPGRRVAIGDAANPALIASEVQRDRSVVVATTRYYSSAPRRLASIADAAGYLGRLQLLSGRTTHFVTGGPGATIADVAALIAGAGDVFANAVLTGRGERLFAVTRSR